MSSSNTFSFFCLMELILPNSLNAFHLATVHTSSSFHRMGSTTRYTSHLLYLLIWKQIFSLDSFFFGSILLFWFWFCMFCPFPHSSEAPHMVPCSSIPPICLSWCSVNAWRQYSISNIHPFSKPQGHWDGTLPSPRYHKKSVKPEGWALFKDSWQGAGLGGIQGDWVKLSFATWLARPPNLHADQSRPKAASWCTTGLTSWA